MTERVTWLELLHRHCRKHGLALLLTAAHTPGSFARAASTTLQSLDVIELADAPSSRKQRVRAGDLCIRADLAMVDGDLEAAAELLVELLTRTRRQAA